MNKKTLRALIDSARRRTPAFSAPRRSFCDAYGIPTPKQALGQDCRRSGQDRRALGFPRRPENCLGRYPAQDRSGWRDLGLDNAADVRRAFDRLVKNAKGYKKNASIQGVQVQQMLKGGQEVMVGAVTDPSFGKMIAFGLGGVLVEVMKDITFRMAPVGKKDALSMLDSIGGGGSAARRARRKGVNRAALADIIAKVSKLVNDFPEIHEVDLNPIFATEKGAQRRRCAYRDRRVSRNRASASIRARFSPPCSGS